MKMMSSRGNNNSHSMIITRSSESVETSTLGDGTPGSVSGGGAPFASLTIPQPPPGLAPTNGLGHHRRTASGASDTSPSYRRATAGSAYSTTSSGSAASLASAIGRNMKRASSGGGMSRYGPLAIWLVA